MLHGVSAQQFSSESDIDNINLFYGVALDILHAADKTQLELTRSNLMLLVKKTQSNGLPPNQLSALGGCAQRLVKLLSLIYRYKLNKLTSEKKPGNNTATVNELCLLPTTQAVAAHPLADVINYYIAISARIINIEENELSLDAVDNQFTSDVGRLVCLLYDSKQVLKIQNALHADAKCQVITHSVCDALNVFQTDYSQNEALETNPVQFSYQLINILVKKILTVRKLYLKQSLDSEPRHADKAEIKLDRAMKRKHYMDNIAKLDACLFRLNLNKFPTLRKSIQLHQRHHITASPRDKTTRDIQVISALLRVNDTHSCVPQLTDAVRHLYESVESNGKALNYLLSMQCLMEMDDVLKTVPLGRIKQLAMNDLDIICFDVNLLEAQARSSIQTLPELKKTLEHLQMIQHMINANRLICSTNANMGANIAEFSVENINFNYPLGDMARSAQVSLLSQQMEAMLKNANGDAKARIKVFQDIRNNIEILLNQQNLNLELPHELKYSASMLIKDYFFCAAFMCQNQEEFDLLCKNKVDHIIVNSSVKEPDNEIYHLLYGLLFITNKNNLFNLLRHNILPKGMQQIELLTSINYVSEKMFQADAPHSRVSGLIYAKFLGFYYSMLKQLAGAINRNAQTNYLRRLNYIKSWSLTTCANILEEYLPSLMNQARYQPANLYADEISGRASVSMSRLIELAVKMMCVESKDDLESLPEPVAAMINAIELNKSKLLIAQSAPEQENPTDFAVKYQQCENSLGLILNAIYINQLKKHGLVYDENVQATIQQELKSLRNISLHQSDYPYALIFALNHYIFISANILLMPDCQREVSVAQNDEMIESALKVISSLFQVQAAVYRATSTEESCVSVAEFHMICEAFVCGVVHPVEVDRQPATIAEQYIYKMMSLMLSKLLSLSYSIHDASLSLVNLPASANELQQRYCQLEKLHALILRLNLVEHQYLRARLNKHVSSYAITKKYASKYAAEGGPRIPVLSGLLIPQSLEQLCVARDVLYQYADECTGIVSLMDLLKETEFDLSKVKLLFIQQLKNVMLDAHLIFANIEVVNDHSETAKILINDIELICRIAHALYSAMTGVCSTTLGNYHATMAPELINTKRIVPDKATGEAYLRLLIMQLEAQLDDANELALRMTHIKKVVQSINYLHDNLLCSTTMSDSVRHMRNQFIVDYFLFAYSKCATYCERMHLNEIKTMVFSLVLPETNRDVRDFIYSYVNETLDLQLTKTISGDNAYQADLEKYTMLNLEKCQRVLAKLAAIEAEKKAGKVKKVIESGTATNLMLIYCSKMILANASHLPQLHNSKSAYSIRQYAKTFSANHFHLMNYIVKFKEAAVITYKPMTPLRNTEVAPEQPADDNEPQTTKKMDKRSKPCKQGRNIAVVPLSVAQTDNTAESTHLDRKEINFDKVTSHFNDDTDKIWNHYLDLVNIQSAKIMNDSAFPKIRYNALIGLARCLKLLSSSNKKIEELEILISKIRKQYSDESEKLFEDLTQLDAELEKLMGEFRKEPEKNPQPAVSPAINKIPEKSQQADTRSLEKTQYKSNDQAARLRQRKKVASTRDIKQTSALSPPHDHSVKRAPSMAVTKSGVSAANLAEDDGQHISSTNLSMFKPSVPAWASCAKTTDLDGLQTIVDDEFSGIRKKNSKLPGLQPNSNEEEVLSILKNHKIATLLQGGAVIDAIRGMPFRDLDILCFESKDQLFNILKKDSQSNPHTRIKSIEVKFDKYIEIEFKSNPQFPGFIEKLEIAFRPPNGKNKAEQLEDLAREYGINYLMYYDLFNNEVIDPLNQFSKIKLMGRMDILSEIHDPETGREIKFPDYLAKYPDMALAYIAKAAKCLHHQVKYEFSAELNSELLKNMHVLRITNGRKISQSIFDKLFTQGFAMESFDLLHNKFNAKPMLHLFPMLHDVDGDKFKNACERVTEKRLEVEKSTIKLLGHDSEFRMVMLRQDDENKLRAEFLDELLYRDFIDLHRDNLEAFKQNSCILLGDVFRKFLKPCSFSVNPDVINLITRSWHAKIIKHTASDDYEKRQGMKVF